MLNSNREEDAFGGEGIKEKPPLRCPRKKRRKGIPAIGKAFEERNYY